MRHFPIYILFIALLASCSENTPNPGKQEDESDVINVGGITGDELTISVEPSRAVTQDAETVDWLIDPLFDGFDIAYYLKGKPSDMRFARLQLVKAGDGSGTPRYEVTEEGYAKYNFFQYDDAGTLTTKKAKWLSNGVHIFRGHYVPEQIREENASDDLSADQSDDSEGATPGNYTLLKRYLSMPANCEIAATVGRIKLPFHHRLARVNIFILIDPEMGDDVTLKGYNLDENGIDDPKTTELHLGNVKVLDYVEATVVDGKTSFKPHWKIERNIIPRHFGEVGSLRSDGSAIDAEHFIIYTSTADKTTIFPSEEAQWTAIGTAFENAYQKYLTDEGIADPTKEQKRDANEYAAGVTGYTRTVYGKVPVYVVIVRPTYTSAANVMYDEDPSISAAETNKIDFTLTLSNGLEYDKEFVFDLDANYQTAVYLRINREQIDYNSSGSEEWKSNDDADGYYGVNNGNGNTLSMAGSGWQRAYRNSKWDRPSNITITDGSDYDENGEEDHIAGEDGQYISNEKWIERFAQAVQGGEHHGDYFVLDNDITIDGALLPTPFVFTGHLDCRGHSITITGREHLFDGLNGIYTTAQETTADPTTVTWEANVHKETRGGNTYWVPTIGYRAEVLNTIVSGAALFKSGYTTGSDPAADVSGNVYNCTDKDGKVTDFNLGIPTY